MKIFHKIKDFYNHYYEAIKMGLLVGLLISNVFLLQQQANTLKEVLNVNERITEQIAADNEARKDARAETQKNNQVIIEYLRCIALINPPRITSQVDACLRSEHRSTPVREPSGSPYIMPETRPQNEPDEPEQVNPEPPEEQPRGLIERINTFVENLFNIGG